jgi:hypothetical protein
MAGTEAPELPDFWQPTARQSAEPRNVAMANRLIGNNFFICYVRFPIAYPAKRPIV